MTAAAEIASALGGARRSSGGWWSCCCPAHEDRTPSLSVRDGDRGLVVQCWAGCDRRAVLAALRDRGLIGSHAAYHRLRPAPGIADRGDDLARRIALARRIWDAARDVRGSPVMRYLSGRAITIAPPASLRWAPALRRLDGTYGPAMVARIDGPDGALVGVHRTWLAPDRSGQWHRRDRAMLGQAARGAVRLADAAETLLVGEGIETTLAGMATTALPGWAGLSAGGIEALILPPIVRAVIILADNDANGRGEKAAHETAARWRSENRRVSVYMSPRIGEDAADLLLAAAMEVRGAAA